MPTDHTTAVTSKRPAKHHLAFLVAGAALTIGASGQGSGPGPDPTWEGGVRLVEAALRDELIDPQSAQIEWPYNFVSGSLKSLFGRRREGWYTCGLVNGRNRMGGYTGKVWFLAMVNSGKVIDLDIGTIDGVDAASATCPGLIAKGFFPPAPTSRAAPVTAEAFLAAARQGAADAASRGGLGIVYQVSVHGALVSAVAPGSPAERAGLKAGVTIERVNDIAVGGSDLATLSRMFAGAGSIVTLDVIGVGKLKVDRSPK